MNMKKEGTRLRGFLKQMMGALGAALKRKTRSLKARLIVYSLLTSAVINKKTTAFLFSQEQLQLQALNTNPDPQTQDSTELQSEPEPEPEPEAIVLHHMIHNNHSIQAGGVDVIKSDNISYDNDNDNDDDDEEEAAGTSVIEMVKHSKEEAGEEFNLEQDIDHVADLFIRNFHRQMMLQKQHSLNNPSGEGEAHARLG